MAWLHIISLIIAGLLACSGIILAKKPDAKQLLDKIAPYQGFAGVAILVLGVLDLVRIGPSWYIALLKHAPVLGIAGLGADLGGALLGLVFGMPLISKWTGKDGSALSAKLAPFSVILGLIVLASAVILLLATLGILKFI